ncbi:RHS repeat-associated core domain-containing protein, partial [Butyricimonas hominis]
RKGLFGLFSSPENEKNGSAGSKDTPFADWQPGDTCYEWLASGMLAGVKTPDGKTISFGYDALGRRVSKTVDGTVRRFGWDGNVVLHEWKISEADRPRLITDGSGREEYEGTEKLENIVTWIYDGTSFTPVAKVTDGERYTIVHDYLGTPTQAYDSRGILVWEMLLDVYGEVKECHGDRTLVPFRYQGQYEDMETELYYNRFRYYSPQMGMYISSDPIGLAGNNPTLYGYVQDVNIWLDIFGLHCSKKLADDMIAHGIPRPANTAAHHIVGSSKKAKAAKDILDKHKIDIDSYVNGVFLPNNRNSSAPGLLHTGRHTNDYIERVNAEIVAADLAGGKDAVLKQLDQIRKMLLNGTYTPPQK